MSEQAPNHEAAMPPTAPAETKTAKEEVMELLREMPDDVTLEEILDDLLVLERLKLSDQSIREGRFFTQEQVEERLKQWLTP